MIVLFTDFGLEGPYIGQMKAVLAQRAPGVSVIDLFADAPSQDPMLGAYLLAAYALEFPRGSVFLAVVDPGVGGDRRAVLVLAEGRWYVGPDNGLFNVIAQRAVEVRWWDITWRPERLSATFHGRDLFAPVAADVAQGEMPKSTEQPLKERIQPGWPEELDRIVYIDYYGNAMTGIRASRAPVGGVLCAGRHLLKLRQARAFGDRPKGDGFWYENANGLVEIAVNQDRADRTLGIGLGDRVFWDR